MPVAFDLEWRGDQVANAFSQHSLHAMQTAGQQADKIAYSLAAVGDRSYTDPEGHAHPGYLRDSTFVIVEPDGAHGYVLIVGNRAPYAVFIELGTFRSPAQPFLRPAGDAAAGMLDRLLAQG